MQFNKIARLMAALPLLLLLGASSCGGGSAPAAGTAPDDTSDSPGRATQSLHEQAAASGIRRSLTPGLDPAAFIPDAQRVSSSLKQVLPPLPTARLGAADARRVSVTELVTVPGKDSIQASPGATDIGEAIELVAPADGYAWALYEMPAISTEDQFVARLAVRTSDGLYNEGGGYWVAVSDYAHKRWDLLNLTQAETYEHSIGRTADLVSPAGVMYLAVMLDQGQSLRVQFVRQQREDVLKPWYVVDPNLAGDHGSYPACAISLSGVPMVAYVNNVDKHAYFLQPDATSDFNQTEDWNNPPQPMFSMQDAPGRDLDLIVDPSLGFPRASLLLDKTHEASGKNTSLGLTVARLTAQNQLEWLSIELAGIDGGDYTSISRDPVSGLYAITTSAANENSPGSSSYDIERRQFDVQQLLNIEPVDITVVKAFGEGLRYPHMRYAPDSHEAYAAKGGTVVYEDPFETYLSAYEETGTELWGSLCFVPTVAASDTRMGNSYARNGASGGSLFSADFDDSMIGVEDEVDSINGAGSWIGGVSQIEYQLDGTPCMAYTYSDGSSVGVRFARLKATSWEVEEVSEEAMPDQSDHQRIRLDLAVEPPGMFVQTSGRLIIAFEQFNGTSSEIRVAVRQPGF